MPKFILLCYEDEAAGPRPPSPEWQALWDAYVRLDEEARAAGVLVDSQPFAATASAVTVSLRNGQVSGAAGPAEHTASQLTGYYLIECPDQAAALHWAARIPAAATGRVEVRRIAEGPEGA